MNADSGINLGAFWNLYLSPVRDLTSHAMIFGAWDMACHPLCDGFGVVTNAAFQKHVGKFSSSKMNIGEAVLDWNKSECLKDVDISQGVSI